MSSSNRISDAKLREIIELGTHFEERKKRAKERLAATESATNGWYFAIIGVGIPNTTAQISHYGEFRQVIEPPGEVELAAACTNPALFSAVGRYSHSITLELAVPRLDGHDQVSFTLAWWIISAVRVRTCAEILIVAVADHPWSTIAGIDDRTCHIQLLEDHPRAFAFEPTTTLTEQDLEWVANHLRSFGDLLENQQFRLAVDSLCTYHHMANKRMAATVLWSGIEALFPVNAELRFRLSAYIAATLEVRGEPRIDCYKRIKKLYDFRSRLVHGAVAQDDVIESHIIEVRRFLSRVICWCTESKCIPNETQLDDLLFG